MKLLFDQNLSHRLVARLADLFPDSIHVRQVGLERGGDEAVWRFALERNLTIVTRDSDFQERSQIAGAGPKVVWVRRPNCSTREIEAMLRSHADQIAELELRTSPSYLTIR